MGWMVLCAIRDDTSAVKLRTKEGGFPAAAVSLLIHPTTTLSRTPVVSAKEETKGRATKPSHVQRIMTASCKVQLQTTTCHPIAESNNRATVSIQHARTNSNTIKCLLEDATRVNLITQVGNRRTTNPARAAPAVVIGSRGRLQLCPMHC